MTELEAEVKEVLRTLLLPVDEPNKSKYNELKITLSSTLLSEEDPANHTPYPLPVEVTLEMVLLREFKNLIPA